MGFTAASMAIGIAQFPFFQTNIRTGRNETGETQREGEEGVGGCWSIPRFGSA